MQQCVSVMATGSIGEIKVEYSPKVLLSNTDSGRTQNADAEPMKSRYCLIRSKLVQVKAVSTGKGFQIGSLELWSH